MDGIQQPPPKKKREEKDYLKYIFENEIQFSLRHANSKYKPAIEYFLKHT